MTGGEHRIDPQRIHHSWDNALEPSLRVASGDVVHYDPVMAGHGQVQEGSSFEDTTFDFATLYNLLGPLHVEGARPGIDPDLMQGTRIAVRAMIDWVVAEHGLSREDAYILCSLAGDLKILEVVDAGVWNVGMTIPLSVFAQQGETYAGP